MGRSFFVVLCGLGIACGSSGNAADGGADGAADVVGDTAPMGCNLAAPFGTPVAITELDTPVVETVPRLTHDELTIYFTRNNGSGTVDALYVATRSSRTGAFGPAMPLALNTTNGDNDDATVTGDGLTLYFGSTRGGLLGPNIFMATRPSTSADFGNVTNVTSINVSSSGVYQTPYAMADGNTLYFDSDVGATGTGCAGTCTDLFRATATTPGSFALDTSGVFANVNTDSVEADPVITQDELTVYYLSDSGNAFHVWHATRASKSVPFGVPVADYELDSSLTIPGWISDDGCRLYMAEEVATNNLDLYVATKPGL